MTPRFVSRADYSIMVPLAKIEKSDRSSAVCVVGDRGKERTVFGDILKC